MAGTGLGFDFDLLHVIAPVDMDAGAKTGARIHMRNYAGIVFCLYCGAGVANDDWQVDLQQHDAASAGTSKDLDIISEYHHKQETTLDGDEAWAKVTQTAASEVTGNATSAETENLVAFKTVHASELDVANGFDWISMNTPDFGAAGAKLGCVFAIGIRLAHQRTPANLPQPQA